MADSGFDPPLGTFTQVALGPTEMACAVAADQSLTCWQIEPGPPLPETQDAHVAQGARLPAPVAELAMERERSLDGLARLVQPALPQAQHAQGAEGARLTSPVAHLAMDRERRLADLERLPKGPPVHQLRDPLEVRLALVHRPTVQAERPHPPFPRRGTDAARARQRGGSAAGRTACPCPAGINMARGSPVGNPTS